MEEEVLFSVYNGVGMITLNRPATLNALTMNMINKLRDKFTRWLEDDEIKVILIKGAGERAFCAGGDVRAVCASRAAGGQGKHIWGASGAHPGGLPL